MKKLKSFSLHNFFWNDRSLIIFSIIAAIIFWAAVCVAFSPETTNVIKDVPIEIDTDNSVPSQCGLQVFGEDKFTVDITVRGSRLVIGENLITAKDFDVTAITSSVTTAGTHSLQLRILKKDKDANFEIESASESFINVYYDSLDKKEIPVTVQLSKDDFVKQGYTTDDNYLMDNKTVVVSGPALEIAQLDSVVASVQVPDDQLSTTTTCEAGLTAYNKNNKALKYVLINGEEKAVMNISIPVYKIDQYGLDVEFTNIPSDYVTDFDSFIDYTVSPSKLNAGVLQNGSQTEKINVGTIDFSEIKSGDNSFDFEVENIKKIMPGSVAGKRVTVKFKVKNVSSKELKIPVDRISVSSVPDGNSIKFSDSYLTLKVYGNEKALKSLDENVISASIDLNNNLYADSTDLYEGPVYLKGSDNCWVYGTYKLQYTLAK